MTQSKKKNFSYLLGLIAFIFLFSFINVSNIQSISAGCDGGCGGSCVPVKGKYCRRDDCTFSLEGDEYYCDRGGHAAVCGCNNSKCGNWRGSTCTNSDRVCTCSCEPVSCPPGIPGDKFRTRAAVTAYGVSCGGNDDCDGNRYACDPKYFNTAPSCSMLPTRIEMFRNEAPRQIQLTVTDNDYGDTVQVRKVRVVDTAGVLRSCVKVRTLGGALLENMVVKSGSDNASDISATTILTADARTAHGVFNSVGNGQSECSGFIEIEIADVDSDPNGSLDVSDVATCRVELLVKNDNPTISNVTLEDRDPVASLRIPSGNLLPAVSAANPLYVGSSWDARRVGKCSTELSIDETGQCNTSNFVPMATRKNPFLLSFTVSDEEGVKDIKEMGFWLQRSDAETAEGLVPLVANTTRQSVQALIGSRSDYTIGNTSFFNQNTCVGPDCSDDLTTASSLLSYIHILTKGGKVDLNGTISDSSQKRSSYKEWLAAGWPDCYATSTGLCTANIPTTSQSVATADATDNSNYDWMVSADKSHMLCLKDNSNTSTVIATAAVCPTGCAACVALSSIEKLSDGKSARASFLVTMNDKYVTGQASAGMAEGKYEIFVGAMDKVAGYANGTSVWLPVRNSGGRVPFYFDAQPPTMALNVTNPSGTEIMRAYGTMNDVGTTPSGLAGVAMRFILKETYAQPEDLEGVREYLAKDSSGTTGTWSGQDDFVTFTSGATSNFAYDGYGVVGGEGIAAGVCSYDKAGNMCCAQTINANATSSCANYGNQGLYYYGSAWLQTSLGAVYSNTSTTSAAFVMSIPETSVGTSALLTGPYAYQSASVVGGIVVSASENVGLLGGRKFGSTLYPLGFSNNATAVGNYRTTDSASSFNVADIGGSETTQWYSNLWALSSRYCEISGTCSNTSSITDVAGTVKQKVIVVRTTQKIDDNLVCTGANIIYITGNATVTLTGQVTKSTIASGCLFVVDKGATLVLTDTPTGRKTGAPAVDAFQASVVVSEGGAFISQGIRTLKDIVFDRLEWNGFLFDDSGKAPSLKRKLLIVDNKQYPAEWIIFDANILDAFRPMLGYERTVDVVCGTSNHLLCQGK